MKQLSSRVFTKLSVEWKADGATSQEVRIRHCGAGEGRDEGEIASRQYDCTQPLSLPSPLPKGGGNTASRKRGVWDSFNRNGLSCAILLVGLCVPTFSRAALVAAWGYDTSGQTRLPVGVNNVRAIAAGDHYSLALMNNGSVVAWGSNGGGQSSVPTSLESVKAIAAGSFSSVALKADGTVVVWGHNSDGQTNLPDNLSRITAIACGRVHTLALNASGTVTAWGQNLQGQTNVPAGLSDVISIAAGGAHSLALRADGSVVAWGYNFYSQSSIPDGLSNVTAIAAGGAFSLALKADGKVVAWGNNSYGQTTIPAGLSNVTAIAASQDYAMALKTDGVVVAWGRNPYGEYPVPPGLSNVTAIATGGYHSLALVPEGPVQILQNPQSQGIPYTSNATFSVVATGREPLSYHWLFNGSPISPNPHLSGTTNATLTITNLQFTDMGTYAVIVSNALGSVLSSDAVLTVIGPPLITSQSPDQIVGAGTFVTLSVSAEGTPPLSYQWTLNGTNLPGRTLSNLFIPNAQPEASGGYSVMVSNAFGTASTTLGLVVTNRPPIITQQPFITTTNLRTTVTSPVPPGSSVALNLSATGSFPLRYQWRFNGVDLPRATNTTLLLQKLNYSQSGFYSVEIQNAFGATNSTKLLLNVSQVAVAGAPLAGNPNLPLGLSDVTALAAGGSHVLALKTDGTVRTWLANYIFDQAYAVTNVPSSATNVIAMAAGHSHCLVLRSNGTVRAWGSSAGGQTNVPASLSNVIAIAAGWSRSYAVKADGTVTGWGSSATVPAGLSNVVAVAAGPSQNLALRRDGTVAFWTTGAFTVVPGLSNAIAIAASSTGNRALRQDGTVVSWPASSVTLPAPVLEGRYPVSNAVAIAVGSGVSLILKQGGTLVASGFEKTPLVVASNLIAIAAGGVQSGFGVMLVGNGTPAITLHPYSQIVQRSNTLQLHARAAGVQPMSYQWHLENKKLPGATNASLLITNAQGKDTGGYQMIASNPLGTATSRIATLMIPYNTNLAAALNTNNWKWLKDDFTTNWFAQIHETHDGDVAAQSGAIGNNQRSTLVTSLSGPGTLTFWWKVSSEEGFDFLRFYLNSTTVPLASISGETDWQRMTIAVPPGQSQTLRWIYSKDSTVSAGRDAGWMDEVVFTPDPPVIISQPGPSFINLPAGKNTKYSVLLYGPGPFNYQWFKDDISLTGATNSILVLNDLMRRDSATYRVQASNAGGSVMSSNAVLKVIVQQRLGSIRRAADGSMDIFSRDADGEPLLPQDLPLFEAQASTNLVHWEMLPNALSLTNGSLVLHDPGSTNFPMRFYRIVEH